MKRILALLLALVCVFAITACRKVEKEEEVPYDLSQSGMSNKGQHIITYDRAKAFYREYTNLVNKYGIADFDGTNLKGVAVVRLVDFLGNGNHTLYVAYADGTQPYVNKQMVVGFDNGMSRLLDNPKSSVGTDITAKATADATAPAIWLYTDANGRGYIVTGEDMSKAADYNTFIGVRNDEKIYTFVSEFTKTADDGKTLNGTYEKIKLSGLSEEEATLIFAENQRVVESMKKQAEKENVK